MRQVEADVHQTDDDSPAGEGRMLRRSGVDGQDIGKPGHGIHGRDAGRTGLNALDKGVLRQGFQP